MIKDLLTSVKTFVEQVYIPDVCAIGAMYPEWFGYGAGVRNYMAVPDLPLDEKSTKYALPGGYIPNGDLAKFTPIKGQKDEFWRKSVTEDNTHAYYTGSGPVHPFQGTTNPDFTDWKEDGKYSWVKAPRFQGKPMQVGPTAHVLVAFAQGHEPTVRWAKKVLEVAGSVAKTKLGPGVLESTLGRHAARAIRCAVLAEQAQKQWKLLVENIGKGDVRTFNAPTFPKG